MTKTKVIKLIKEYIKEYSGIRYYFLIDIVIQYYKGELSKYNQSDFWIDIINERFDKIIVKNEYGRWVLAQEFRKFTGNSKSLCLSEYQKDLIKDDIEVTCIKTLKYVWDMLGRLDNFETYQKVFRVSK